MVWFVLGLILAVVALVGVGAAVLSKPDRSGGNSGRAGGIAVAVIAGVLSFGLLFASATREVPARSVGVPVTVGQIGQSMRPGLHFFQPPWEKVDLINERYQTVYYDGKRCIQVRIGGQQLACWQGSVQYKVRDQAAPGLFASFGNTGNLTSEIQYNVVYRSLYAALTHTFADYNPIVDVSKNFTAGNSQFSQLQPALIADVRHLIGKRIEVSSLLMKNMIYNQTTQNVLERIQQQQGKTAQAQEQIATNREVSLAINKLDSAALSPAALQYMCYQVTQEAMTIKFQLSQTWNCSGNGSNFAVTGK